MDAVVHVVLSFVIMSCAWIGRYSFVERGLWPLRRPDTLRLRGLSRHRLQLLTQSDLCEPIRRAERIRASPDAHVLGLVVQLGSSYLLVSGHEVLPLSVRDSLKIKFEKVVVHERCVKRRTKLQA